MIAPQGWSLLGGDVAAEAKESLAPQCYRNPQSDMGACQAFLLPQIADQFTYGKPTTKN